MHACTEKGPRARNEDHFHASPRAGLVLVCDGMGGHPDGDVAARLATDAALGFLRSQQERIQEIAETTFHRSQLIDLVREAVAVACAHVYEHAGRGPDALQDEFPGARGMGTTLALLLVVQGTAVVAHVGDSRVYLLRDEVLHPLTRDHNVVAELVDSGVLDEEQARSHRYAQALSRAVGLQPTVEADAIVFECMPGDRFLLCTDGCSMVLDDETLTAVLGSDEADPARELVQRSLEAGTRDNSTAVVVQLEADPTSSDLWALRTTQLRLATRLLSHSRLLRGMTFAQQSRAIRQVDLESTEPGQVLARPDEAARGALLVLLGSVEVSDADGRRVRAPADSILMPGAVLGIDPGLTVRALVGGRVAWLSQEGMSALAAESPATALAVMKNLLRASASDLEPAGPRLLAPSRAAES